MKALLLLTLALSSCKPLANQESMEESSGASGYISSRDFFDPTGLAWTGRLIMPETAERRPDGGVWFEVYDGAKGNSYPKRLWLTWDKNSESMSDLVRRTTIDITMNPNDLREGLQKGNKPPEKLNGLKRVSFLESLAGSRSERAKDNINGILTENSMEVLIKNAKLTSDTLLISSEPIQIIGRYVSLLSFLKPAPRANAYQALSWKGSDFSDQVTVNYMPPDQDPTRVGWIPTLVGIENSVDNKRGWYAFGDLINGQFTVRALEPRSAMGLDRAKSVRDGIGFINNENFKDVRSKKGTIESFVLQKNLQLTPKARMKGLVIHLFGGIDGQNTDTPIVVPRTNFKFYTGHFAFGVAEIVTDPFTKEPKLDIEYRQIYATNEQSIVSGATKWHSFSGSLRRGWMYARPLSDSIIWHPSLMYPYSINGHTFDPMATILDELTIMAARFRTSDGFGIAKVTSTTSCVQDSSQAMYIALSKFLSWSNTSEVKTYVANHPGEENVKRLQNFKEMAKEYLSGIIKWAGARSDWGDAKAGLVINRDVSRGPGALLTMAASYKFVAPRFANDNMLKMFYDRNALIWIVKTSQIGGSKNDIFPEPAGCDGNCWREAISAFKALFP